MHISLHILHVFAIVGLWFLTTPIIAQDGGASEAIGILTLEWSPDSEKIALAMGNGDINFTNRQGSFISTLNAHEGKTMDIDWGMEGQILFSGGSDGFIRMWNTETGELLVERVIFPYDGGIYEIALDSLGNQIITSGFDRVRILDVQSLESTTSEFSVTLSDVAWSSDNTHFAFSATGGIGLARIEEGELSLTSFGTYDRFPSAIDWSADGTTLISAGGRDGSVRLWDVERGEQIRVVLQTDQTITDALFIDPTGSRAAAITEDGQLYILNTETGETLETFTYEAQLTSLAWNPVYNLLAIGGLIPIDQISDDPNMIPGLLEIIPLATVLSAS